MTPVAKLHYYMPRLVRDSVRAGVGTVGGFTGGGNERDGKADNLNPKQVALNLGYDACPRPCPRPCPRRFVIVNTMSQQQTNMAVNSTVPSKKDE